MKRIIRISLFGLLVLGILSCGHSTSSKHPQGKAQDLWGNKINLSDYQDEPLFLHYFSPATCGYCLVEGDFIHRNYELMAAKNGGNFFEVCLYAPQLDIYAFQKTRYHSRASVLTAPQSLTNYQNTGYPYMAVFKRGENIYSWVLTPYEAVFDSLCRLSWGSDSIPLRPTSPLKMAEYFLGENQRLKGIEVCADGNEDCLAKFEANQVRIKKHFDDNGWTYAASSVAKSESSLNEDDLRQTLGFSGSFDDFSLDIFAGKHLPFIFEADSLVLGDYVFAYDDISFTGCCPNPYNPEHYIIFDLHGPEISRKGYENYVDFFIFHRNAEGQKELLLDGFFDKSDSGWYYSPTMTFGSASSKLFCRGGVCPTPRLLPDGSRAHPPDFDLNEPLEKSPHGTIYTLGEKACRFPSIMVGRAGICRIAWEDNGNIMLASIDGDNPVAVTHVEYGPSDSYNPVMAEGDKEIWIFYLDDRDGFYRVYGRSWDGRTMGEPALLSEQGPTDAITLAADDDGQGNVALLWSDWQANSRYLKLRRLHGHVPGPIETAQAKITTIDYTNAWFPSLVLGTDGTIQAVWNQHYPATLGVYAGDLVHDASAVIPENGDGAYPDIVVDSGGTPWVFWVAFRWRGVDTLEHQPIQASFYDTVSQQWSLPYTINEDTLTTRNQVPRAAVDIVGRLWVVWSGLPIGSETWSVFLTSYEDGQWSTPVEISTPGENARAPVIAAGNDFGLWIAWHSGIGDDMRIKVLRYGETAMVDR